MLNKLHSNIVVPLQMAQCEAVSTVIR